ncbi:hypothetical protein WMY93_026354 [Mugilogobius chulae]|uniref:Uncharacterized protein n=1 Tax=Mugilogobius chulae TaxID=88201 RepID=A0AAW0N1Q4_9GOBI
MSEVKLEEDPELWEPKEEDNTLFGDELKEDPDGRDDQSPDEADASFIKIKEEIEEQKIQLDSIPVIVSVCSEKEPGVVRTALLTLNNCKTISETATRLQQQQQLQTNHRSLRAKTVFPLTLTTPRTGLRLANPKLCSRNTPK